MKNIVLLLLVIFIGACSPKGIAVKENYKDGKLHGEYVMYYEGYPFMTGYYDNGKKTGEWKRLYSDGRMSQRSYYVDDKLHGVWIDYYSSQGVKEKGIYIEDKKTGEWISYYEEGETYLGRGEDGEPAFTTDLNKEYGQIREKGEYIEGKKNGKWLYYDKNGRLLEVVEYKGGETLSTKVEKID